MTPILACASLHMARCQRTSGVRAFEGLHLGQHIGPHCALALCGHRRRFPIHSPYGPDRFRSLRILRRRDPRPKQMQLERRAACRGDRCAMMPRAILSKALSCPEKSADRTLCGLLTGQREHVAALSALLCDGVPGRSTSVSRSDTDRSARGMACMLIQRPRHLRTVSTRTFRSRAISAFLVPSAAPSTMRPRFARCVQWTMPSDTLPLSALCFLASSQSAGCGPVCISPPSACSSSSPIERWKRPCSGTVLSLMDCVGIRNVSRRDAFL